LKIYSIQIYSFNFESKDDLFVRIHFYIQKGPNLEAHYVFYLLNGEVSYSRTREWGQWI